MSSWLRLHLCLFALLTTQVALGAEKLVQLSPDTYMIVRDSKAGAFASMAKLKGDTIAAANAFAAARGKVAVPIRAKETRAVPFTFRWPQYEYQFRLVDPGDPAAAATSLSAPDRNGVANAVVANTAADSPTDSQVTTAGPSVGKTSGSGEVSGASAERAQTGSPDQSVSDSGSRLKFDDCFAKCRELTSRSAEQCFDACK